MPSIADPLVAPKGGYFEGNALEHHDHDAEMLADVDGLFEQRGNGLGRGIGGDVDVAGIDAQKHVADTAAGE